MGENTFLATQHGVDPNLS